LSEREGSSTKLGDLREDGRNMMSQDMGFVEVDFQGETSKIAMIFMKISEIATSKFRIKHIFRILTNNDQVFQFFGELEMIE
jgi:hypothetical protein